MTTLGERLKMIRKKEKLNQTDFGALFGKTLAAYYKYENNTVIPDDTFIKLFCSKFSLSEEWLRTGEGEMFQPKTEDEELEEAINRIFSSKPDAFRRRLFKILARLNEQEWLALEQVAVRIAAESAPVAAAPAPAAKEPQNEKSAAKEQREETEEERRARLHAELDAQLDAEKAASEKKIALNVAS